MGFFDRLAAKKSTPPPAAAGSSTNFGESVATPVSPIVAQLLAAREKLEAQDLPGAMALYEQVLAAGGDRPDVLVTISGDLGTTGNLEAIVDLIAPRYDAERHGPATGLNLLQAYLALRNSTAAQHLLDILFGLRRPELQDRLYGFSNALAELIEAENRGQVPPPPAGIAVAATNGTASPEAPPVPTSVSLVSISKPVWFYGLEGLTRPVLPPKADRLRRIAFGQLAIIGLKNPTERMKSPEDELGRFSRAFPLWLAETFYFSPLYSPIAAVGLINETRQYALFSAEWTTENLRQLVDTSGSGLDYIFTGAIRQNSGDTEMILRVWEVKKFRERKQFTARWNPATMDAELKRLQEQVRLFMEWSAYPAGQGIAYSEPSSPRAWLEVLGASLTLFLGEKSLLIPEQLTSTPPVLDIAAENAVGGEAAALAWITLRARARQLNLAPSDLREALVPRTPIVEEAQALLP